MARERDSVSQGPAWLVQAALVARRFYLEGRSKVEIADELGMSRFKIARILDEARDLGLVEVTVRLPAHIDSELSTAVQQRFGLRRAIVVDHAPDPAGDHRGDHRGDHGRSVREELGRVAADLLTELVTPDDVLGLTCSRSVTATTHALRSLAACRVIQLTGTLAGPDMEAGSVESVRQAADVGGGKAFPIYAPMVLPDPATATALSRQSSIVQAVEQFDRVTIAMVAIGAWESGLSTVWETVDPPERAAVSRAGGVGEIGARVFDTDGAAVPTRLDDRVLGVTLEQLRTIPEVIGLAYGAPRAAAVRAALRRGVINSLVCDADLGRHLLDPGSAESPAPDHSDQPRGASA